MLTIRSKVSQVFMLAGSVLIAEPVISLLLYVVSAANQEEKLADNEHGFLALQAYDRSKYVGNVQEPWHGT